MISPVLLNSWRTMKPTPEYAAWKQAHPDEANALEYLWNHGKLDPTRATIKTQFGMALAQEAQSYYGALAQEATAVAAPTANSGKQYLLDGKRVSGMNHWPSVSLNVGVGTPVFAMRPGKIPHINGDGISFPYDAVGGLRWAYSGVKTEPGDANPKPGVSYIRRPALGQLIGHTSSPTLIVSCQKESELFRAIFAI